MQIRRRKWTAAIPSWDSAGRGLAEKRVALPCSWISAISLSNSCGYHALIINLFVAFSWCLGDSRDILDSLLPLDLWRMQGLCPWARLRGFMHHGADLNTNWNSCCASKGRWGRAKPCPFHSGKPQLGEWRKELTKSKESECTLEGFTWRMHVYIK